jgi:hypothetical protein
MLKIQVIEKTKVRQSRYWPKGQGVPLLMFEGKKFAESRVGGAALANC